MNDTIEKSRPSIFYAKNSQSSVKSVKNKGNDHRSKRKNDSLQSNSKAKHDRIETFKVKSSNKTIKSSKVNLNLSDEHDSPWQKKVKDNAQTPTFGYDEYRQKKEETLVYSENSCRAVFKHRRSAIVKLFITQEMTYQFKDLINWLVKQRLGYDVVSTEQITKITQNLHHGGVCLIVKKRIPLSLLDYLHEHDDRVRDCILAIDDVNNPHNLGGLVRSAAFFGVNGIILRQTNLLDSGSAMRVAEGGIEAIEPIKSDDFIVSIDILKKNGYQIIALLPCQSKSIKSTELSQLEFKKKVVLIIFQQINTKLINCADNVVHLSGNDNMSALNISVAAGIVLSTIKYQS